MTDYGTMETTADGRYILRYERRLRHPVEKVWAALTEPDRMEEWWARAAVLELAEGGRARYRVAQQRRRRRRAHHAARAAAHDRVRHRHPRQPAVGAAARTTTGPGSR